MAQQILVFGGTGTVGSEIVKVLKAEGHTVRIATSKVTAEADKVHVNPLTREGLDAAFAGVDAAFFLSPGGYADQYSLLAPLIAKAKEAQLKKVVLMTAIGVDHAEGSPLRRAELDLINSGVPFNIIRPSWFDQNFQTFWIHDIQTHGAIRLPAGDGKAGFIDVRDIAASAAKLLTTDAFNGEGFTLTGPEALDHNQVTAILSQATGKTIGYQDITPEEFKQGLLAGGVPDDYSDLLVALVSYIKAGYTGAVTGDVEKITGRKPRSFEAYAVESKGAWA